MVVEIKQVKAAGRIAVGGFIGGAMNAMSLPSAGTAYDVTMDDVGMSTPPGSVVNIEEIPTPAGTLGRSGRMYPGLPQGGPLLLEAGEEEVPITIRRTRRRLDFDEPASSKKVKKSRSVNTYPSQVTVRDHEPSDTFPFFDLPLELRSIIYGRSRRLGKAEAAFRDRKPAIKRRASRMVYGVPAEVYDADVRGDVGPILEDRPMYELIDGRYRFNDRRARVAREEWEVE